VNTEMGDGGQEVEVLDVSEVTDEDDLCDFCLGSTNVHEDYVRGVAG
jgi:hypothetical protein